MNGKATKYPRDDEMTQQEGRWNPDLAGDYDRIAEFYADAYADDLGRAPFDQIPAEPVCGIGSRSCLRPWLHTGLRRSVSALKTIYAMLMKQEGFRPMAKGSIGQCPGVMLG